MRRALSDEDRTDNILLLMCPGWPGASMPRMLLEKSTMVDESDVEAVRVVKFGLDNLKIGP